ncbi:adenine phosphoribosyltransferase [Rhodohalobacter halophilus]|uniref:adenine phosphoribosyltransferase n=1 Tax=Rhodohalobacter halophilus TaxID=1812810 RepID=UPI00083F60AE|nr:adenine phosphoribosyltransferase [Rhodohalobacter halophilus]
MSLNDAKQSLNKILKEAVRSVSDFPKPGIVYKDITPLLNDKYLLELTSRLLAEPFRGYRVDYVAGLESRGFLFGTNLAQDLHAGFIPIRKPNKLPAETESVEYELEYGTDILEMHKDSIQPGDNVLIHDDLIATGGSALAATRLVEKLGGNIIGYSFVMEIEALNGVENLDQTIPFHAILSV